MSNLAIFENSEFGKVRTLIENDGTVLFCASDVAKILGYSKPANAVSMHCKTPTLKQGIGVETGKKADGSPAMQEISMTFIPEGDVYRLIIKSRLPAAEQFERWVMDEVLPSIRKTGSYSTKKPDSYMIEDPVERALAWAEEQRALRGELQSLKENNMALAGEVLKWEDRAFINACIRRYAAQALDGNFAQAWISYKKDLLYKHGISLQQRQTNHMNTTGKKIKTLDLLTDDEVPMGVQTAISLCITHGIEIDDLKRVEE